MLPSIDEFFPCFRFDIPIFISGAEPHVNTCYKHFYYFVTEFNLMNEKEFSPLLEMTKKICTDLGQHHQPSTASPASKLTTKFATLSTTVEERFVPNFKSESQSFLIYFFFLPCSGESKN